MKHLPNLLLLFLSLFFVHCSVQKRHYRSGFHVERHHANVIKEWKETRPEKIALLESESAQQSALKSLQPTPPDTCDLMVMRDGSEKKVRVVQIDPDHISYKSCEQENAAVQVIKKKEVFKIDYSNGTREVFPSPPPERKPSVNPNPTNSNKPKKKSTLVSAIISNIAGFLALGLMLAMIPFIPYGISAFVIFGLIAVFFLALVAMIFGIYGIIKLNKHPNDYKGLGLIIPPIIISSLILLIYILFVTASLR